MFYSPDTVGTVFLESSNIHATLSVTDAISSSTDYPIYNPVLLYFYTLTGSKGNPLCRPLIYLLYSAAPICISYKSSINLQLFINRSCGNYCLVSGSIGLSNYQFWRI